MHYNNLSEIAESPQRTHSFLMIVSSCTLILLFVVVIVSMKTLGDIGPVFDDVVPMFKDAKITLTDMQDIMPEVRRALAILQKICENKFLNITCDEIKL